MAQRSLMYYAYFRFYIDPDDIESGLTQFCTEWEHMYAVGYNYREYKCFVDNLGGFEHWVGDMQGYISPAREVGFIDGSPSDNVFDQSLLMGKERTFTDNIILLNGYKTNTKFIFRKITAKDAGTANKVSFKNSVSQKITHPVMYTLDATQIEIINQTVSGFVDNSTVSEYEVMVESSTSLNVGAQDSVSGGAVTDISNAFDRDDETFAKWSLSGDSTQHDWIIDMQDFTNMGIDIQIMYSEGAPQSKGYCTVYHSKDKISWTMIGDLNFSNARKQYSGVGLDARYVKIHRSNLSNWPTIIRLYRLMCS